MARTPTAWLLVSAVLLVSATCGLCQVNNLGGVSGSLSQQHRKLKNGPTSYFKIFNACSFAVLVDYFAPQPAGSEWLGAGQTKTLALNPGDMTKLWKVYANEQDRRDDNPVQLEFSYDWNGKVFYDLSYIDSRGAQLENVAITQTCSDGGCAPAPQCWYIRCATAYNPDGSPVCQQQDGQWWAYYPACKSCKGEPSFAAAGGSTVTWTLC